jgi:hypothetical protein
MSAEFLIFADFISRSQTLYDTGIILTMLKNNVKSHLFLTLNNVFL